MNSDEILKTQLAKALAECERLWKENAQLRLRIGEDLEESQSVLVQGSVSRQGRRVRGQLGRKER